MVLEDLEHLLCGEWNGNIDILNLLTWQIVQTFKINSGKHIIDIVKLPTPNLFALALNYGGV